MKLCGSKCYNLSCKIAHDLMISRHLKHYRAAFGMFRRNTGTKSIHTNMEPWRKHYDSLLCRPEWNAFRDTVIRSRNNACDECGTGKFLQVHHPYYKRNTPPWGYGIYEVRLLCATHHKESEMIEDAALRALWNAYCNGGGFAYLKRFIAKNITTTRHELTRKPTP